MKAFARRLTALLLVCAFFPALAGAAESGYPQKPITLVVPYGAGGTADLAARQLAVQLKKHLGVPVTVFNQGGASGSIGAKYALDARPDGYTLFLSADSLGTLRVMGISPISYHDFTPIFPVVNDPKVIVVGSHSPYASIEDLLRDMQARPGKVKMSYTGPGGSGHVQSLILKKYGYEAANIAYAGGADAIVALMGGQVDFTNANYSTVAGYAASGAVSILAVSSAQRLPALPDVPALSEVIEGSEAFMSIPYTPLSLLVRKDVPEAICAALREAFLRAVKEKEWADYCQSNSLEKLYERYPTPEAAAAFYADWEKRVSWLLYDAGAAAHSPAAFGIPRPQ